MKKSCVVRYYNTAVIDRRFRPLCCHLGSYFKRPKSSPVRPLACNWYYCAQLIAKPEAARSLHHYAARGGPSHGRNTRTKSLVKIGRVVPKIWSRTDKHTHRHAHHNTPFFYRGGGGLTILPHYGSRVVSMLNSGAVGPGFKSQPRHCRITVLDKLLTPIVPLFTKQRNW